MAKAKGFMRGAHAIEPVGGCDAWPVQLRPTVTFPAAEHADLCPVQYGARDKFLSGVVCGRVASERASLAACVAGWK